MPKPRYLRWTACIATDACNYPRQAAALTAILAIGITAALAAEPAASYEKTRSDISVSGITLKASCNTFSGQSMPTSLDFYASCVDDIGNINGALACAGPNGS